MSQSSNEFLESWLTLQMTSPVEFTGIQPPSPAGAFCDVDFWGSNDDSLNCEQFINEDQNNGEPRC